MSFTSEYKGYRIVFTQKGPNVSAKVGGVNVAINATNAQEATKQARAFIDEQSGGIEVKPKEHNKVEA